MSRRRPLKSRRRILGCRRDDVPAACRRASISGEVAKPRHQPLDIARRVIEAEAQSQPSPAHICHDPACVQTPVPLRSLRVVEGEEIAARRLAQRDDQTLGHKRTYRMVGHRSHELRLQRDGMGVC
jgi:hypothetical protein